MEHVGVGRAKLLLFGEHAAVYGYPAVGLSLDTALRVRLQPGDEDSWKIEGVQKEDRGKILEVLELLERLSAEDTGASHGGGTLLLESEIPRGLGFGSSASLCVALAAAIGSWRGGVEQRSIWEWAHRGEKFFHGTPSGIDTGLALLGGMYSFRPDPPQLPDAERLAGTPLHLVVGAVPRRRSAAALIGALREKMIAGDVDTKRILQHLGTLATKAGEILKGRHRHREDGSAARDLGALAREAQAHLGRLGLSTPELDRLLEDGTKREALGGKLSGAGGGGAFFLIYPDAESARSAASALRQWSRKSEMSTADTIHALSWPPAGRHGSEVAK